MAEIGIGIAASVITLGTFSVEIFKFSKKLYDASKKVPYLEDDISRTVLILESSATAINTCHTSLQHLELKGDDTRTLKNMRTNGTLKSLDKSIEMVSKRFDGLLNELDTVRSPIAVWSVFRWSGRKPGFEDLAVQLECIKTSIMMIMIITLLDINRIEAQKMDKMLKGRHMATVRAAFQAKLERDSRTYTRNLEQQQEMAESLISKRRQNQTTNNNAMAPSPTEPILKALGSLVNMAQEIEKPEGWDPIPNSESGENGRRKPSMRMRQTPPAAPTIVAHLNPQEPQFKLIISTHLKRSTTGAPVTSYEVTAMIADGLPDGIAVMKFSAAKRVNLLGLQVIGKRNEVFKFPSGRLEPVIGRTTLNHKWEYIEGRGSRNLSVYVVINLRCDIMLASYK